MQRLPPGDDLPSSRGGLNRRRGLQGRLTYLQRSSSAETWVVLRKKPGFRPDFPPVGRSACRLEAIRGISDRPAISVKSLVGIGLAFRDRCPPRSSTSTGRPRRPFCSEETHATAHPAAEVRGAPHLEDLADVAGPGRRLGRDLGMPPQSSNGHEARLHRPRGRPGGRGLPERTVPHRGHGFRLLRRRFADRPRRRQPAVGAGGDGPPEV